MLRFSTFLDEDRTKSLILKLLGKSCVMFQNAHNTLCSQKSSLLSSHTQLVAMPSRTMQWRTATRKVGNLISHVTSTPRTLAPRPPDVCEKNVFHFFRASASGKQHF